MTNDEKIIEIKTEDGKVLEGQILFAFEANGDDFVLYEIGDEAFAAKYNEKNELEPVQEDEWPLVEKIFNEYMEESEEDEDAA